MSLADVPLSTLHHKNDFKTLLLYKVENLHSVAFKQ